MTTEPHTVPNPETPAGHDSVEMPRPTVAPLVLSLGVALLAMGVVSSVAFLVVGGIVLAWGVGLWVAQMLPGRGHFHEALAESARRPLPVTGQVGKVAHLAEGMPGYRMRLPEKVHPLSAGVKGGIVGGLVIPIPAILWGLFSQYHSIWFPINLLAGMVLPGVETLSPEELGQFHFGFFLVAVLIHITTSVTVGLIYGVLLPTLPHVPTAISWGGLLMPLLWTASSFVLLAAINPVMREGVGWPSFIFSQFLFGLVAAAVVVRAHKLSPLVAGALGGIVGGMLMPVPAVLWSLTVGHSIWYPSNLLAGFVVSDIPREALDEFHANWLAIALAMHLTLTVCFGILLGVVAPRLPHIPGPVAWGGLVMPVLWTGSSYGLMGVVNPVLQQLVSWPWFVVSQFLFGLAASVVVIRSEQVYIPPAGAGPDRLSEFVAGQEERRP